MGIRHLFIALWAAQSFFMCESAEHKRAPKRTWKSFFCLAREKTDSAQPEDSHLTSMLAKKIAMSEKLAVLVHDKNKEQLVRLLRSIHEDTCSDEEKRFAYELACRHALCDKWVEGARESYNHASSKGHFAALFGRIDNASEPHAISHANSSIAQVCLERGEIALLHEWTEKGNIIPNQTCVQQVFDAILKSYAAEPTKWQKDGLQYLIYTYNCQVQHGYEKCVNELPSDCFLKSLLQEGINLTEQERSDKRDALLRLYGYKKGSRIQTSEKRNSIRMVSQIVRSASSVTTSFASGSEEVLPSDPVPERSLSLPEDLSAWFKQKGSRIADRGSRLVKVTKESTKKASSMVGNAAQRLSDALGAVDAQTFVELATVAAAVNDLASD